MRALLLLFLFSCTIAAVCEANGAWLAKVPEKDRVKTNPYQSQPDAVAAGALVYEDHCSHCHGKQAEGNKKHPSLKSERVQLASRDVSKVVALILGGACVSAF